MSKNILITGGFGFVGSNLAKYYVDKGDNVTLLSRSDSKIKNISGFRNSVNTIFKDIRDIDGKDVSKQDYIFHLASTVDNYNINTNPYLDIEVNCNGTIALLEACKNHNIESRIVFGSTFFVNGNLDKLPATPESQCNPMGLYPATKLAAEHFCKIYNQVFGLNTSIARFTNVFGVNESGVNKKKAAFNYLINLAINNEEIPVYGDGKFKRDYIYVEDVCSGLQTIAEKGSKGEIYYVGRGEEMEFKNLVDIIIEESKGGKIKYINPPEFHNKVGIKDYFADISLIRKLGWEPKISIREGIKRTINYYKNE